MTFHRCLTLDTFQRGLGLSRVGVTGISISYSHIPIGFRLQGNMNNCWYRVKIHRDDPADDPDAGQDERTISFEHPTQPGMLNGGWLQTSQASEPESERELTLKLMHQESSSNLDLGDQLPSTPRLL